MPIPELLERQAKKQLTAFVQRAAADPLHPRQLRYRLDGSQITLFEVHLDSPRQQPVAQLRYSTELSQWTLHHQNGENWQLYLNVNPSLDLNKLLLAIRQDPLGCFWGD